MSVVTALTIAANGLYVPFRGVSRGKGPVGTLMVTGSVTGDAGGGSASITIRSEDQEFGFHGMYAATRIHVVDLSVTPQAVRILYSSAGNERLSADFQEALVTVEAPANNNHANSTLLGIPIEPVRGGGQIMAAAWGTNIDTIVYEIHAFFMVYDLEELAKQAQGEIGVLLAGIR